MPKKQTEQAKEPERLVTFEDELGGLLEKYGGKAEALQTDAKRPLCVVGEGLNRLYNSGVTKVIVLTEGA